MTKKKEPHPLPIRHHKPTDQAYVLIDGERHYLGRFGEPGTQARYDQFLMEWLANGRRLRVDPSDLMVVELCDAFRRHADAYYINLKGKPSNEAKHFQTVIKALRELYGRTPACEFGPIKFKAVREKLMADDRSRRYVNQLAARIKRLFKWGVAEEMVPASVLQALQAVPGLKRGRTTAPESERIKPVPIEFVDAVRPHVSRQVAAIIDLQLLTAARSGEVVIMRPIDIDTSGKVWVYSPKEHKTQYSGHDRKIYLGPKAQDVVRPFLKLSDDKPRPVESFLFSPAEAEAERRKAQREARTTPLSCGNRPGTNRVRKPRKAPGERYDSGSYRRAIQDACKKAGVDRWHPHQLRHSAATNLRKQFGLDVASIMLGHARCDVTQIYAEKNHEAAMQIAAKVG